MSTFKAAVAQSTPVPGDTQATLKKILATLEHCGKESVNVVVFPEAMLGGYPKGASFDIRIGARTEQGRDEFEAYYRQAIEVPGTETREIAKSAKEHGLFVTIGVIERDGGTLHCTALYFTPDGELAGKHRKLMPTAAERLCWGFGDGSTLEVVPTPWGNMGAVICWENYMPLLRTAMYDKQVTIYCTPTADDRDTWAGSMQHVALEGRCFVLSACQFLRRADFPAYMHNLISDQAEEVLMRGGSMIVDPLGRVVAGPDFSGECVLMAELDTALQVKGKFDFDVVGHYARPDIFSLTVDERPRNLVTRLSTETEV